MAKVAFGARAVLYPLPVTLIGSVVGGKANFMTCSFCGIAQMRPPLFMASLGRSHHTNGGIKETRCFSANIPSCPMVEAVDYCGIASGRHTDKTRLFTVTYGKTGAPLAEECPVNIECRLVDVRDYGGSNEIFLGEIVEVYVSDACLDERGKPDMAMIDPLLLADRRYWAVGGKVAQAFSAGRGLDPRVEVPAWVDNVGI